MPIPSYTSQMRLSIWVGGMVVLSQLSGCDLKDCNEIGCSDGVEAELSYTSYDWPDGEYRIEVDLDAAKHVCTFSFPSARPRRDTLPSLGCEPDDPRFDLGIMQDYAECYEYMGVDAGKCAPTGQRHRLQLRAASQPKALHLRIEHNGELVIEKDEKLKYTQLAPNGAACGPICTSSQSRISLD